MSSCRKFRWWYNKDMNFDSSVILRKRVCPSVIKCISIRRQYMSSLLTFHNLCNHSILYHSSDKEILPHYFFCTKPKLQFLSKSLLVLKLCYWLKISIRLMTKKQITYQIWPVMLWRPSSILFSVTLILEELVWATLTFVTVKVLEY